VPRPRHVLVQDGLSYPLAGAVSFGQRKTRRREPAGCLVYARRNFASFKISDLTGTQPRDRLRQREADELPRSAAVVTDSDLYLGIGS
jgi:hypothetical protein